MVALSRICDLFEALAPRRLAEEWDNVGLLVGDASRPIARAMTCLTVTPESVREAVAERADLVVAHHPLPFRPLKRITADDTPGRLLLALIENRIAVYSPHTAFDSAAGGINEQFARGLGLSAIRPLVPICSPHAAGAEESEVGSGRVGEFSEATTVSICVERVKRFLAISSLQIVGDPGAAVRSAAVACGSAGQFLSAASRADCDLLVTGETNFHTCLEAEALGVALILPGHYASERFAVEALATRIAGEFPKLHVWPSRRERDPLVWV